MPTKAESVVGEQIDPSVEFARDARRFRFLASLDVTEIIDLARQSVGRSTALRTDLDVATLRQRIDRRIALR